MSLATVANGTLALDALGYIRVSTDEQETGLDVQRAAITEECASRGWRLLDVLEDEGFSAKDLRRPAVQDALIRLKGGSADVLVVSKLDRLSRSLLDFAELMDRARREGWAVVLLDLQVDTTTPSGEMLANVLATFAQFERRLIGQRTRDALAVKKANGVKLGRPSGIPSDVRSRILSEHDQGSSFNAIAGRLNLENVPTSQGGARWWPSTVRAVVMRP